MEPTDEREWSAAVLQGLPGARRHPWQEMANLIRDHDGILDATADGLTVALRDGTREFKFEGGLTEEHFEFLIPRLASISEPKLNTSLIAQAVLENILRREGCDEPDVAWRLLHDRFSPEEENWLPQFWWFFGLSCG